MSGGFWQPPNRGFYHRGQYSQPRYPVYRPLPMYTNFNSPGYNPSFNPGPINYRNFHGYRDNGNRAPNYNQQHKHIDRNIVRINETTSLMNEKSCFSVKIPQSEIKNKVIGSAVSDKDEKQSINEEPPCKPSNKSTVPNSQKHEPSPSISETLQQTFNEEKIDDANESENYLSPTDDRLIQNLATAALQQVENVNCSFESVLASANAELNTDVLDNWREFDEHGFCMTKEPEEQRLGLPSESIPRLEKQNVDNSSLNHNDYQVTCDILPVTNNDKGLEKPNENSSTIKILSVQSFSSDQRLNTSSVFNESGLTTIPKESLPSVLPTIKAEPIDVLRMFTTQDDFPPKSSVDGMLTETFGPEREICTCHVKEENSAHCNAFPEQIVSNENISLVKAKCHESWSSPSKTLAIKLNNQIRIPVLGSKSIYGNPKELHILQFFKNSLSHRQPMELTTRSIDSNVVLDLSKSNKSAITDLRCQENISNTLDSVSEISEYLEPDVQSEDEVIFEGVLLKTKPASICRHILYCTCHTCPTHNSQNLSNQKFNISSTISSDLVAVNSVLSECPPKRGSTSFISSTSTPESRPPSASTLNYRPPSALNYRLPSDSAPNYRLPSDSSSNYRPPSTLTPNYRPSSIPGCRQPASTSRWRPPASTPGCGPPASSPGCRPTSPPGCRLPASPPGCRPPASPPGCRPPAPPPGCRPPASPPSCRPPASPPGCRPPASTPGCRPPASTPGCRPLASSAGCRLPATSTLGFCASISTTGGQISTSTPVCQPSVSMLVCRPSVYGSNVSSTFMGFPVNKKAVGVASVGPTTSQRENPVSTTTSSQDKEHSLHSQDLSSTSKTSAERHVQNFERNPGGKVSIKHKKNPNFHGSTKSNICTTSTGNYSETNVHVVHLQQNPSSGHLKDSGSQQAEVQVPGCHTDQGHDVKHKKIKVDKQAKDLKRKISGFENFENKAKNNVRLEFKQDLKDSNLLDELFRCDSDLNEKPMLLSSSLPAKIKKQLAHDITNVINDVPDESFSFNIRESKMCSNIPYYPDERRELSKTRIEYTDSMSQSKSDSSKIDHNKTSVVENVGKPKHNVRIKLRDYDKTNQSDETNPKSEKIVETKTSKNCLSNNEKRSESRNKTIKGNIHNEVFPKNRNYPTQDSKTFQTKKIKKASKDEKAKAYRVQDKNKTSKSMQVISKTPRKAHDSEPDGRRYPTRLCKKVKIRDK